MDWLRRGEAWNESRSEHNVRHPTETLNLFTHHSRRNEGGAKKNTKERERERQEERENQVPEKS